MKKEKLLNSSNLKQELWDTLQSVKTKEIDPSVANAIASQSREIMRIVKLELTVSAMSQRKPSAKLINGFSGK